MLFSLLPLTTTEPDKNENQQKKKKKKNEKIIMTHAVTRFYINVKQLIVTQYGSPTAKAKKRLYSQRSQ